MGILVFSASIQSEDDFNSITIKIGKEKALVLLDAYNNLWLRTSQCFPNSKNQLINSDRSLQNSLLLSKYTQNDPNTNSQYSRSSDFYDANSKLYYSKAEFFHKNNLSASGNFPKNNPETSQVFSEILDIVVGNNSFNRSAINNKHENSLKGSKSNDSIISENSIGSESDIYESSDSDSNLIDDQLSESHPIYTDLIEDAQNTQNIQNNSERNIGSSAKNVFPATTSGFDEDDGYANSSRNTSFESINDLMIGFDINGTDVSAIRNYTSRNLKSRKSDQFFGYLFYLNSIPEKVPDRDKILYFALVDILLIAAVFSILSAIVGWCWIKISKTNAKTLVWLTVIFVPVTCIMVAMNAGFNIIFPGNQNGRKFEYEIWIRNVFVLTGSLFIAMKNILYLVVSQVAQDLRMIFDLGMFILSLFIFASFGFMVFISSLTIYMNPLTEFYSLGVDVLVWYIVSFVWITCVILQFHRAVSSSTIGQWYFHRHEPGDTGKWFFGQTSVYLALSDWFGTICLSGLIQMVAVIVTGFKSIANFILRLVLGLLSTPISLLLFLVPGCNIHTLTFGKIQGQWITVASRYTVVYMGLSGLSFIECFNKVKPLLYKHELILSPTLYMIESVFDSASWLFTLLSMNVLSGYALFVLKSPLAFAISIPLSIFPLLSIKFVFKVFLHILDSLVVCYAIDLESGSCHSVDVENALAFI
ncbi:hypothetical protein BB559_000231 [Furculomyces boomerangus]|uniref:Protein PNS1 n=1 Tax=Furculomyces boomerangus TaxID=61424 RepID=A0A2T9Z608_9FUNG|nr:hypothetical protein BB559_000231 [Furculomyces boomerangus]